MPQKVKYKTQNILTFVINPTTQPTTQIWYSNQILPLLLPSIWFVILDLLDVYFCVKMRPDHQIHFQFQSSSCSFLFALAVVPWVFTKVVVLVVAYLQKLGCEVYPLVIGL